ncbi:hypothetical protein D3C83_156150 [compost metagenome]
MAAYGERAGAALAQLRALESALASDKKPGPDAVYWNLAITFGIRLFEMIGDWSAMAERQLRRR